MQWVCNLNPVYRDPHLNFLWPFYTRCDFDCDWPLGGAQLHLLLPSQAHNFFPGWKVSVSNCYLCLCNLTCLIFVCEAFRCSCVLFGSLGCALDCWPLSRHCPLDPKLSDSLCQLLFPWLPFTVTFSASSFGIYIWDSNKIPQQYSKQVTRLFYST